MSDIKKYKLSTDTFPDPLGIFVGSSVNREYQYGSQIPKFWKKGIIPITMTLHTNGVTTVKNNLTGVEVIYRRGFRDLAFKHVKRKIEILSN